MQKLTVFSGLLLLLFLTACQSGFMNRDSEVSSQEPAQEQKKMVSQGSDEFYGQAPDFENIPETIVLEAKNGNITFPHRTHAKQMECKTCHEGTPGKMPEFGKDKAHPLCMGCHKEKGAGPTKCGECHKKS